MNYVEALDHPDLFGRWFAGPSWAPWRVVERAIFGLPIEEADLPLFRELTGRDEAPDRPGSEAWIIAGRRSAKSRKAATIGTYLATIGAEVMGYRKSLAPGERGIVLVMGVDKPQAKVVLDYARALFREIPLFRAMVERETDQSIELTNGLSLVVMANDFRSIRGRTLTAVVLDEAAYWRHELTTSPDLEVYRAVKPGLATVRGLLLIGISSPYRRAGLLWRKFRRHWGKAGDVLVVKAKTEVLNPEIDKQIIEEAYEDDPEAAGAEWGAEFRDDLADFVRREVVEALVSPEVYERPRVAGVQYRGFTDAAGGSGGDSYTLAIAHREGDVGVLDATREVKPPFSPEQVTGEFAATLRQYGVREVKGDKFAGEWPREQFRKQGITYLPSDKTKSEIYSESLPLINGGRLDLLDDQRLVAQICGLERRTARGGRDSVDHGPGGHDDLCNAALGVLQGVAGGPRYGGITQQRLLGV